MDRKFINVILLIDLSIRKQKVFQREFAALLYLENKDVNFTSIYLKFNIKAARNE